ncbi:MAG: hypothetical protein ACRC7O_09815 [Fimbriiglobus sp.]
MAFASFKSLDDVLRRYSVREERAEFVRPTVGPAPSDYFLSELRFTLAAVPYRRSEMAACETLIYPVLREVWRHYTDQLSLFSHEPIPADDDPRGETDYLVTARSPLSAFIPDRPILLVGEAKRDDFQKGWAQALAGMVAASRLDGPPGRTIYGLSTTGAVWSFGNLTGGVFTNDPRLFPVQRTDELFAALHFVFAACRDQVLAAPVRVQ